MESKIGHCVMAKIGRLMGELYMIVSRRQSLTAAHFCSQLKKQGGSEQWYVYLPKLKQGIAGEYTVNDGFYSPYIHMLYALYIYIYTYTFE